MVRDSTARTREWANERQVTALRHAKGQAPDEALREWCEVRAHPRGMLLDGECFCGLIRYDD
jgi:hypothetical protein